MAMHMVMHIMPCVVVSPVPMPVPRAMAMHPREALPGNPSQCVWDERALYIDIGTGAGHWQRTVGIIRQHRCCSPAASTDMAVVRRPKHWKQLRSKQPMGVLAVLFPVRLQGPPFCGRDAVNTPSVPYLATVPTMPVFSARASRSTHSTRHTPHTTPPSLLQQSCQALSPPPPLPAPSHVLRTLHYAPGPGVEVGWARFAMRCHGTVYSTVPRCIRMCTYGTGWARPNSPPFASDTMAATRITAWPRRPPHQGRERFRSSRWLYRDRALDHTRGR